jgi:hypothetical protein
MKNYRVIMLRPAAASPRMLFLRRTAYMKVTFFIRFPLLLLVTLLFVYPDIAFLSAFLYSSFQIFSSLL